MIAIAIVCVMLLLLTFYQVHTQGFFSTVIMTGDCLIAALIAMNYYEQLAELLAGLGLAGYGLKCITLLGLFSVSLLILRLITDKLVKGNMNFPQLVDRIGSTAFGLISSMIIIGMIVIGFQHVAVPATFMGFNRYPDLGKLDESRSLFPGPDRFVLSLVNHCSTFSFSGKHRFGQHHSDMLQELYLNRIVPKYHEGSRREAAYGSVETVSAWLIDQPVRDLKSSAIVDMPPGETLLAVRLKIKPGKDKDNPGASDADDKIRYKLGSFRLVGYDPEDKYSEGYSRYPVGYLKASGVVVEKAAFGDGEILATSKNQVDLLFRWPGNVKKISPAYIEFKRSARANVKISDTRDVQDMYASSKTAERAKLENRESGGAAFAPEELIVVSYGSQPLEDMRIPTNPVVNQAEQLVEVEKGNGYRRLHIAPTPYQKRDTAGGFTPLYVPDGFCLVYLKVRFSARQQGSTYIPPILVDIYGQEHHSVGFAVSGKLANDDVYEFAYSSYNSQGQALTSGSIVSRAFVSEIKLLKQGGTFSQIVQFYLVAQKDIPVGLLGVRVKANRNDPGSLWTPTDDIDAVLVPAAF